VTWLGGSNSDNAPLLGIEVSVRIEPPEVIRTAVDPSYPDRNLMAAGRRTVGSQKLWVAR
jgi:hypothetical protein